MAVKTVYLITGSNRGLGLALVTALLLRSDHIVIATGRPESQPPSLASLRKHETSTLVYLSLPFSHEQISDSNPAVTALASFKQSHPEVNHIDVVISNAGFSSPRVKMLEVTPARMMEFYAVNSIAPVLLWQATWPLLQKSANPKFVTIGSTAGSTQGVDESGAWADAAYGASKAAAHYLTRKLRMEVGGEVAVMSLHPGWVRTDMGNRVAKAAGMEHAPILPEDSVKGLLEEIGTLPKGKDGGLRTFDHLDLKW